MSTVYSEADEAIRATPGYVFVKKEQPIFDAKRIFKDISYTFKEGIPSLGETFVKLPVIAMEKLKAFLGLALGFAGLVIIAMVINQIWELISQFI